MKSEWNTKEKVIPYSKVYYQGSWLAEKFYFFYRQYWSEIRFGVFDLVTEKFMKLKLPTNIPHEWTDG